MKMGLFNIFKKKEEPPKEFSDVSEISEVHDHEKKEQIKIMMEKLENFASTDKILRNVKQGNIVIVRMKELKETNMEELKQSINKLKTNVAAYGGDIAGVSDEWLVVAPSTAMILRSQE
jgi:SepF-like predicted cell division protein (DUF552 family)